MKYHLFTGLLPVLFLLSACETQPLTLKDNSFECSVLFSTDDNTRLPKVTMTLDKGSREQAYTVSYSIDKDPSIQMSDLRGNILDSGFQLSFEDFTSRSWLLPVLKEGNHTALFNIRSESFSQEFSVPFIITTAPFRIHAEILTPASSSVTTVMLTLVEGTPDRDYTGAVRLDGEEVPGSAFEVNFAKTPVLVLELPLIRPGSHKVSVETSDGTHSESTEVGYEEPLRHPNMDIYLRYDRESGYTQIMFHENPYGLAVTVKDSIAISGRCDYSVTTSPDCYRQCTDYKEHNNSEELTRFIPQAGKYYNILDRKRAEKMITDDGHQTMVWEKEWRSDSEGYWDYYEVSGPFVRFRITSLAQFMSVVLEAIQGLCVHVHADDGGGYVWNGHAIKGNEFTYTM